MAAGRVFFDRFELDAGERRLTCDGETVELNARYFDALALMAGEPGRLVSKDRFLAEVWRGVPVTDEALTQCVRALRKALGDDASRPRFIETVPKHGYRFIAETVPTRSPAPPAEPIVAQVASTSEQDLVKRESPTLSSSWRERRLLGLAGMMGGAIAGAIGGVIYGFAVAGSQSGGGASTFVVLVLLTALVGAIGGAAVGLGMAASGYLDGRPSPGIVLSAALGGLVVGALFRLLGADAFTLLFGHGPQGVTGPGEGFIVGAAVGFGAWAGGRWTAEARLRISMAAAAVAGVLAGVLIAWRGGRLMGGSLDALSQAFPDSRLRLDAIAALVGEDHFGRMSLMVTSGLEGGLFAACVVGAMILRRRS